MASRFAVAVTPAMLELMDPSDAADPISRQFVPDPAELDVGPEERADPLAEARFSPVPGIVHRHPDRLLLKPVNVCSVYCRFCFRRETVGRGRDRLTAAELDAALGYIRGRPEVWEVILTGGDPLVLSPRRLGAVVAALDAIEHVRIIRVHTRVPVVDPERIGDALIEALAAATTRYVVLHANHPRELTAAARDACRRIVDAGIPMLSQTVLLRGVNDDPATLTRLLRTLAETRVKPYYLHHADLARGTGHFRTTIAEGQALMRRLRRDLSGICQPTYVLDIPGGHGKVPIGPCYLTARPGGGHTVRDGDGRGHRYPPTGR